MSEVVSVDSPAAFEALDVAPAVDTSAPRVLVLTRDDPQRSTGGVESFCRLLLRVFPGSEVLAYSGAAGRRVILDEARDARAILPALEAKVATMRPAAVIANGAAAWPIDAKRAARLAVPIVTVYHGTYAGFGRAITPVAFKRGWIARTYGAFLERRAGRTRAAVVAVSAPVAAEADVLYGNFSRLIENCATLDPSLLRPRPEARARLARLPTVIAHSAISHPVISAAALRPLVLFVGRAEKTKGFDSVIALARRRSDLLVLAAGVEWRPGLPVNLLALGRLGPADLADAYAAADLVVLPSFYEGCPFALIDAIQADRPIVTTATGCFPVPGVHPFGIVMHDFEPRAADAAFVACVGAALEERHRFTPRAFAGTRFSFERFARDWRALVAEVRHGA